MEERIAFRRQSAREGSRLRPMNTVLGSAFTDVSKDFIASQPLPQLYHGRCPASLSSRFRAYPPGGLGSQQTRAAVCDRSSTVRGFRIVPIPRTNFPCRGHPMR